MSNQHNNGEAQVLGFRDCMSFCIGQIIGSGIMVLTGIALAKTGRGVPFWVSGGRGHHHDHHGAPGGSGLRDAGHGRQLYICPRDDRAQVGIRVRGHVRGVPVPDLHIRPGLCQLPAGDCAPGST